VTTASNIPANAPADLVELIHTAMQDAITKDCVTTLLDIAGAVAAALPAPDEKDAEIDVAAIETGTTRWHGNATEHFSVRWEPYKPDGQRQMKSKGRWQRQEGSGDYWRWVNCDRPSNLKPDAPT